MKKTGLVILFLIISVLLSTSVSALYEDGEGLYSDNVYMENLDTGKVVLDIGSDEKIYPASLTKVLTCIIALEHAESLDETVEIPGGLFDDIYAQGGANIALKKGEIMTVSDLIHATLIRSACDSATALAYYVSGSVENFAKVMNSKAHEIGAKSTHFVNAHGLHDDNHYTTAHDLALIAKYALQNKDFCDIISKYSYTIPETNMSEERYFESTMELEIPTSAHYYPHVTGIKSGFTDEAGRCLITKAEKNGESYLLVTLGANRDRYYNSNMAYTDAANLYEYMFAQYSIETILTSGSILKSIPVEGGVLESVGLVSLESVERLCAINEVKTVEFNLPEKITAPVTKGTEIGSVTVTIGDESFTKPLFAVQEVAKAKKSVFSSGNAFLNIINFLTVIIYVAAAAILILFCVFFFKKRTHPKK